MTQRVVEFKFPVKTVVVAGVSFLALLVGVSNTYFIQPGETAVVTRAGNLDAIWSQGMHFSLPLVSSVTRFDNRMASMTTDKLNTYTIDNQEVDATLVIQYSVPASSVKFVFTEVGDIKSKLYNMAVSRWKSEAGNVNVSDMANQRKNIERKVFNVVKDEAKRLYGVDVADVQLFNLDYQESYRLAQAKAATVKTEIEFASGQQTKAEIEAKTAKITASGQADKAIEEARGRAQSVALEKKAEADGIALVGSAQAEAQRKLADALTANPNLVAYQQAKQWNGQLPVNIYGSAPIPYMNVPQGK